MGQVPGKPRLYPHNAPEPPPAQPTDDSFVQGLSRIDFGPPLASTAERTKPYDYGLVAVLEKPEQVATYAAHPAHQKVHHERLAVGDESVGTLAYDLEIP